VRADGFTEAGVLAAQAAAEIAVPAAAGAEGAADVVLGRAAADTQAAERRRAAAIGSRSLEYNPVRAALRRGPLAYAVLRW
jgi:hypothetical protein